MHAKKKDDLFAATCEPKGIHKLKTEIKGKV
jgi:hypothetical protein